MVPRGVETLDIFRPFGLIQESKTFPTGSLKLSISLRVVAIELILSSLSSNLSINDSDKPLAFTCSVSFLFASRINSLSFKT